MNLVLIAVLCMAGCLLSLNISKSRQSLTDAIVWGKRYRRRMKLVEATAIKVFVTDTGNTALLLDAQGCKDLVALRLSRREWKNYKAALEHPEDDTPLSIMVNRVVVGKDTYYQFYNDKIKNYGVFEVTAAVEKNVQDECKTIRTVGLLLYVLALLLTAVANWVALLCIAAAFLCVVLNVPFQDDAEWQNVCEFVKRPKSEKQSQDFSDELETDADRVLKRIEDKYKEVGVPEKGGEPEKVPKATEPKEERAEGRKEPEKHEIVQEPVAKPENGSAFVIDDADLEDADAPAENQSNAAADTKEVQKTLLDGEVAKEEPAKYEELDEAEAPVVKSDREETSSENLLRGEDDNGFEGTDLDTVPDLEERDSHEGEDPFAGSTPDTFSFERVDNVGDEHDGEDPFGDFAGFEPDLSENEKEETPQNESADSDGKKKIQESEQVTQSPVLKLEEKAKLSKQIPDSAEPSRKPKRRQTGRGRKSGFDVTAENVERMVQCDKSAEEPVEKPVQKMAGKLESDTREQRTDTEKETVSNRKKAHSKRKPSIPESKDHQMSFDDLSGVLNRNKRN